MRNRFFVPDFVFDLYSVRVSTATLSSHSETGMSAVGTYWIAIFKIRPELDSTGYKINYPAGTGTKNGYLNTCCIANVLVLCVV